MNYELRYKTYLLKHEQKQNRGAKYSRDSERLKCYRAEWAFERQVDNPVFKDIKDAERYAKKIYKSKTWQKLWERSVNRDVSRIMAASPSIVAKQRSSGRGNAGHTNGFSVTLDTKVGLNKYTLLHELTHCLGHMHHGRSFRKTLLDMVGAFMGAKEKKLLKAEFKKRKLACGEARKPMDYDTWVASVKRMEKMREE